MEELKLDLETSWVFDDWRKTTNTGIEFASSLRFTDFVAGVVDGVVTRNGKRTYGVYEPYTPAYGLEDRKEYAEHSHRMAVHLMAFIYKKRKYLKDCYNLLEYAARVQPKSILLNIEGPGLRGNGATQDEYEEFFVTLSNGLRGVCSLGVVVIPPFPKQLIFALEDDLIDYVILEAYSFWKKPWSENHWSHSDKMFPGDFQRNVVEDFLKLCTDLGFDEEFVLSEILNVGLANYDMDRPQTKKKPATTQKETFELCVDAVRECGVRNISVWSEKHFKGCSDERVERRKLFTDLNATIGR